MASWKKQASKIAYQSPFFSVEETDVLKPVGSRGIYYTIHKRQGVGVIAFNGGNMLMVSQYRYPIQKTIWSFVAGGVEHQDPLEDAKRELKEESGYTAGKWTKLGLYPTSPSLTDQFSHLYLAEQLTDGDHEREGGELDMQTRWFSFAEIEQMIANNELSGFEIADYYLFKKYLEKR